MQQLAQYFAMNAEARRNHSIGQVFAQSGPGTDIPLPTGRRKRTIQRLPEAKSDGLIHPGRGTLKWRTSTHPLTIS